MSEDVGQETLDIPETVSVATRIVTEDTEEVTYKQPELE